LHRIRCIIKRIRLYSWQFENNISKDMRNNIEDLNKKNWRAKTITNTDYSRIVNRINDDIGKDHFSPNDLHSLYLLAANSKKNDSRSIPNDVVTINSEIILICEKRIKRIVRIVFPQYMESDDDVSVYSPLGVACLGAREKDYVIVEQKGSVKRFIIDKIVFQPESERAYHL